MSEIKVDTVAEKSSANGVTVDGLNIKDSKLVTANSVITSNITDANITTAKILDDNVTYAKIQNVSATNRILGRDSANAGVIEEITPANLRTMLNVADGSTAGSGGTVAMKIETVFPSGDVISTSTTHAEISSGLRITHAMAASGNKLIFMFTSTNMYITGTDGKVGVAKTGDATTSIIGDEMMRVKASNGSEPDTRTGIAEYAPGATTEFTYTPVWKRTGNSGSFYINNSVSDSRWTFTLTEIT